MKLLDKSEIKQVLQEAKTIAVVGASDKPERDSNRIMKYLIEHGYNGIPVNPASKEILGKKCYPSLLNIPEKIDIVDIFRKPEDILPIVEEAISIKAKTVWMQLGIINEEAANTALNSDLNVVMNRCIFIEHKSLILE